jgi:hypothetical protein
MRPSIAEKMDNWMDNFAVPDASVSALSVLSIILLTSSTARLLGSSRERSRRACAAATMTTAVVFRRVVRYECRRAGCWTPIGSTQGDHPVTLTERY